MKTLASPSSSVVFEIYRDREAGLVNRAEEACFFRPQKKNGDFRFLNLVAFLRQRKPIKPVCLSSKTQAELETTDAQIQEAYPTKTMHVKFQLQKECSFGQQFLIVGDDPMLGLWDPSSAIPMDWSDGNVWSVELDIPVGKSIQFKFILKGRAGNILWQPGPDRIFHTWDTKNTITVFEDWGDAELQKITEEEQGYNQIEDSNVNSDMLIEEAENLTYPKEEEAVFNMNMEPAIIDSSTDPAQIPLMEPYQEQMVADNISVPQEKPKTIVAENITPKWPKQMMEPYQEQMVADNISVPQEKPKTIVAENITPKWPKQMMEAYQEQMVADNISVPQEKPKTIVAENITPKWPKQMMEPYEEQMVARTTVLNEERIVFPSADSAAISNNMMVANNIFGNNGRAATARNLTSSDIGGSLINYEEEGPVLVPGFTRVLAVPTEEANKEEVEKPMTFDGSVGAYEAKELNMPELEEKQEPYSEPPQAETIDMLNYNEENFDEELEQKPRPAEKAEQSESDPQNGPPQAETTDMFDNNEVNFDEELKQKPQPAETAEQSDSEPIRDVLNNDMQWGRKILQKLLFNFRLP